MFLLPLESLISVALFPRQLVLVPRMLSPTQPIPKDCKTIQREDGRPWPGGILVALRQVGNSWGFWPVHILCTSREEAGGGWSELRLLYPWIPCGSDCPHTSRLVVLKDSEFSDALR